MWYISVLFRNLNIVGWLKNVKPKKKLTIGLLKCKFLSIRQFAWGCIHYFLKMFSKSRTNCLSFVWVCGCGCVLVEGCVCRGYGCWLVVCVFVCMFLFLIFLFLFFVFVFVLLCLFIYLFIYLLIDLFIYLFIVLFIYLLFSRGVQSPISIFRLFQSIFSLALKWL